MIWYPDEIDECTRKYNKEKYCIIDTEINIKNKILIQSNDFIFSYFFQTFKWNRVLYFTNDLSFDYSKAFVKIW